MMTISRVLCCAGLSLVKAVAHSLLAPVSVGSLESAMVGMFTSGKCAHFINIYCLFSFFCDFHCLYFLFINIIGTLCI